VEGFIGLQQETGETLESDALSEIKKHELYGYFQLQNFDKDAETIILVNNCTDVAFANNCKFNNILSTSGKLTQEHLEFIQTLTNKILVICNNENDETFKCNIKLLYENGFDVFVMSVKTNLAKFIIDTTEDELLDWIDEDLTDENVCKELRETIFRNVHEILKANTVHAAYYIIKDDLIEETKELLTNG